MPEENVAQIQIIMLVSYTSIQVLELFQCFFVLKKKKNLSIEENLDEGACMVLI